MSKHGCHICVHMQAGFAAEHYAAGAVKKLLASPAGAAVAAPPMPEDAVLATSSSGALPQQQAAPAGKAEKVRPQEHQYAPRSVKQIVGTTVHCFEERHTGQCSLYVLTQTFYKSSSFSTCQLSHLWCCVCCCCPVQLSQALASAMAENEAAGSESWVVKQALRRHTSEEQDGWKLTTAVTDHDHAE